MYTVGVGFVPVCEVGSGTKVGVEGKIVEALTGAWVDDAEEVLTEVLPGGVSDANDNANDSNIVPVGQINNGIELVVDSGIVKV